MTQPRLVRISGALAEAEPLGAASLFELVSVGEQQLLGEVVRVNADRASIQVFEDTTGLALGEPVVPSGRPLTASLGPGLLSAVLDGIGRPLQRLAEEGGPFLTPGMQFPTLAPDVLWTFAPTAESGSVVLPGDELGRVVERSRFTHRVLVPPGVSGALAEIADAELQIGDPCAHLEDGTTLYLRQEWPLRRPRPFRRRLPAERPLLTGQRVLDLLMPVAEGGAVAMPGGFGTGKTVLEQTLAKFAEADVVVYVGCGERGNEMAEVLEELPQLIDPHTQTPLLDRTVLVINTSNMPVAARDASIHLGLTFGEYYRDMGYRVLLLADSLSRWAEAHRELAARLGEMPGEEGYPTYLASRLAQLYERAGSVETLGEPSRVGSLTLIGAVSPPGSDFSEPVTQACLRVAGALWALDPALAHQRQYPAVDWEASYSLYLEATAPWMDERSGTDFGELRGKLLDILQHERELREIAGLVGVESLEGEDRLLLEIGRLVRDVVLGQSALDPNDACSSLEKTVLLATLAVELHESARQALVSGATIEDLDLGTAALALARLRSAPGEALGAPEAEVRSLIESIRHGGSP